MLEVFEAEFQILGHGAEGFGVVGRGKVRVRIEGEDTDPAFFVEGRRAFFGSGVCVFVTG